MMHGGNLKILYWSISSGTTRTRATSLYKTLHNLYTSVIWLRGWRMHKKKLMAMERISGVTFL